MASLVTRPRSGLSPPVRGSRPWSPVTHSGLSPPVRGSRIAETDRRGADRRSIPARAGEPVPGLRPASWSTTVYPRPCGGALELGRRIVVGRGSIPARAGEPSGLLGVTREVYPRPCGGAQIVAPPDDDAPGLSPPVRGSLAVPVGEPAARGSIPARAGEPSPRRVRHGGYGSIPARAGEPSLCCGTPADSWSGSIPARAGEPVPRIRSWPISKNGLSPPVRGSREWPRRVVGLSPPVRGSPATPTVPRSAG